jgi:dihydroorotate dehydrogenase electron transfer subunit
VFQEFGVITDKRCLAPGIYELTVFARGIAENAMPGQFVMVRCSNGQSFLRRPFSVAAVNSSIFGKKPNFNLIFKVIGPGTQWLSERRQGNSLDIIGPLGHGYNLTGIEDKKILLIGGGIAIASLVSLTLELIKIKKQGSLPTVHILFGDKTAMYNGDYSHYVELLSRWYFLGELIITTEDGKVGLKGMATDILANLIKDKGIEQIFACGPKAMLKKVAEISRAFNVPCQVCLEEMMACGVGACYSCVCKVNGHNQRVCKDGPVFDAKEVDWS